MRRPMRWLPWLSAALVALALLGVYLKARAPRADGPVPGRGEPAPAPAPTLMLEGLVHDESGAPIPGAWIQVEARRGRRTTPVSRVTAGDDGRYSVDLSSVADQSELVLSTIELEFKAGADGYAPEWDFFPLMKTPRPSLLTNDFMLYRAAVLRGRVVDAPGRGVADVQLETSGMNSAEPPFTAPDGSYVIYADASEPVHVAAGCAEDETTRSVTASWDQVTQVEDIVLPEWATISGVVVLPDGSPGSGLRVWTEGGWGEEPGSYNRGTSAVADAQGRFLVHVPERGHHVLGIEGSIGPEVETSFPGGERNARLVRNEVVLTVRVIDAAGVPFPGADIDLVGGMPETSDEAERLLAGTVPVTDLPRAWMDGEYSDLVENVFFAPAGSVWRIGIKVAGKERDFALVRAVGPRTEVVLSVGE